MENDGSEIISLRGVCPHCSQKLEFPASMRGVDILCPACDNQTWLYSTLPSVPVSKMGVFQDQVNLERPMIKKQVSTNGNFSGCVALIAMFAVLFVIMVGCDKLVGINLSDSGYSSHDAGVSHWEQTLKYENQRLNGTRTETDEEIHRDAQMLQHEEDEGIGPAGMMEREMDGRNNPDNK